MLASHRTGAIIAIEREIGLRNYIESGIPLDAEMTYDLLVTIFQPGSPLHDGAVVLQENRVAAAACFLPLTINPVVSRDLGTRHRAAIGLTEENDAIAVVVSEERGQIAIALEGRLERDLTTDQLRERLQTLISPRRTGTRRPHAGRRSLMAYHPFRHLGLKVLAIILASVLWFTVAGEHVVERSLRVPLAVRNLDTTLEIVGELPAAVDVRVRGSAAQLSRLDSGDVVAMLDLSTARTGPARLFHLRTDEVIVPYGIDVAQVLPPTISLSIEKSVRRTGADHAGDRRRPGAGVCRGADFGRAGDRAGRRPRKPCARGRLGHDRAGRDRRQERTCARRRDRRRAGLVRQARRAAAERDGRHRNPAGTDRA